MESKLSVKQKEQIIIVVTVAALVLMFIGISYAYFTSVNNVRSGSSIVAVGGKMTIDYQDGNSSLLLSTNIKPSNDILIDKTFTLTGVNTTIGEGINMPYTVSIEYQNTFQNDRGELEYYIKRMDTNENISCTLKGFGLVNDTLVSYGYPESQTGYVLGYIDDWSGNASTQELAYGEFKSSTEEQVLTLNLRMMFRDTGENQNYNKGATFNGKIVITSPETNTFGTDAWEEIANNVKSGNASKYRVGSEKEVEIGGKSYTVRVANNTTPTECGGSDFSETACGFVVEFVDVVELRNMNPSGTYNGVQYDWGWNKDGWPATAMRTYANGDFFNKLPSDLQSVIIDTKVISGHGSEDTSNFTSTDKIYLLSTHEVWEDVTSNNRLKTYDPAYNNTRQLDYYKARNVTTDGHFASAIKWYKDDTGEIAYPWWLRAANSDSDNFFWYVYNGGGDSFNGADDSRGFALAFRIG